MTECVKICALLPHLVLGDVSPYEQKGVENHLAACANCRHEYTKIALLLEDLQQSLQSVSIPEPLSPDKLYQKILSQKDSAPFDWMDTPPALWRNVMVALQSVNAPEQLSPERLETIFEHIEQNNIRKKFVNFRRKIAVTITLAAGFLGLFSYLLLKNEIFETHRSVEDVLCLIRTDGARGLDIPETLPGTLRLDGGEATVHLNSGVTLTLLGPAELEIKNEMFVRLYSGRLLADVPHPAIGFTVRTQELEVYDLGTIFSVSAVSGVSDVFVFKGSVQVNESGEWGSVTALSEAGMSICKEGEGVYKKGEETPIRFTADNSDTQILFEKIKGVEAQHNPVHAIRAARMIADSWIKRYMPDSCFASENNKKESINATSLSLHTVLSATSGTEKTLFSDSEKKIEHFRHCTNKVAGLNFMGPQIPNMYFSADSASYHSWNTIENWCFYQSCGGGFVGRLPNSNDIVRINAATLAAEDGCLLNIGRDVNAECYNFASGYMNYPGTACLKMNGGTLTSQTTTVIGMYYPALALLESGSLYSGTDFVVGGYGNPSGCGIVTNNGVTINTLRVTLGHETGTFGRLVHNGGYLDCRAKDAQSSLQVGVNGGIGEFEANADFSVNSMYIGQCDETPAPYGTGTVTMTSESVGVINNLLHIGNGSLLMKGGTMRLENTTGALTNLYVCRNGESQAMIRGWGKFTCTDQDKTLRMINKGSIIADGYGENHDLDFSLLAVVNGQADSQGWDAVNKGRVLFPRTSQSFSPDKYYCLGDLYSKTQPELINSLSFSFSSPIRCIVRGGFCASDRSDIPAGLPAHLKPLGVWCLGAYSDKVLLSKASFSRISLTFLYDHTKLKSTDSKLQLYRYDGKAWLRVGECVPDSTNLISTDTALTPVSSGNYNIGWFALMDVEKSGTVIMIF